MVTKCHSHRILQCLALACTSSYVVHDNEKCSQAAWDHANQGHVGFCCSERAKKWDRKEEKQKFKFYEGILFFYLKKLEANMKKISTYKS